MKSKIISLFIASSLLLFSFPSRAQSNGNAKKNKLPVDTTGLSNSLNKVLDAFTKAVSDNPKDTSTGDLVIKALGNLTGGGGISSADSANTIRSFRTAQGGSGYYYETTTTVSNKQTANSKSVSKTYLAASGEGRIEMNLGAMMGAKNTTGFIALSRIANRRCNILLDEKSKSYSLNVIDTALINGDLATYKVTRISSETVNGFSCSHSKLTSTTGKGMFSSTTTMDIWTSPDVPGYSLLQKMMSSQQITFSMLRALQQAGCDGYIVKLTNVQKDFSMTSELTLADKRTFPASLFMIPAGYTQSEDNLMFSSLSKGIRAQGEK